MAELLGIEIGIEWRIAVDDLENSCERGLL